MRKTDKDNIWQFVVDADETAKMSHIGDKYDVSGMEEMKKAFDGPAADKKFETDAWGKFLSGYAPIRDKDGRAVAVVGVDIKADYIMQQQKSIINAALIILFVVILISTISSRYLAARFFRPVSVIKEEMAKLKGNADFELYLNTHDEFAELASMINQSVHRLAATGDNVKKALAETEKEKSQFHLVYSNLIKDLTGGKLRLATPREMDIYLSDGAKIDELTIKDAKDAEKVPEILEKIQSHFSEARFQEIKNALMEAVHNVIKHAGQGVLTVKNFDGKLRFVISDQGPGMALTKLPHDLFLKKDINEIPEKGFSLLYKSADYIIFASSREGTTIVLDYSYQTDNSANTPMQEEEGATTA